MIQKIATTISTWLSNSNAISKEDTELYEYAAYSLVFGMLPVFLVTLYGLFMGILLEGILMIIPFMLLRKFCGGYHLSSPKICFFVSSAVIILSLILIKLVLKGENTLPISIAVGSSVSIICIFSPIDSEARKLTHKEIKIFGTVARILAILFALVYYSLIGLKKIPIAVPIGVGITLPALLQIPCFIFKFRKNYRKAMD